jgi:CheY-like chemotaxis protein
MAQKKQPVEILCSECNTNFRLWIPAETIQNWGEEGTRISCIGCGAEYHVKQGKMGLEAVSVRQGAPVAAASAVAAQTPAQDAEPVAAEKQTVLVIEDDKVAREMVKNTLKDIGVRVVLAQNSAEALKFIKTEPVDLIVTDLYLKGAGDPETLIDGEEVLRKVVDLGKAIPSIITTGKDILDDMMLDPKWFDLRVKGFIQKGNPFWADELKLKIKEVMYRD